MLLVRLCFMLVFDVGQLLALYFSLVVLFFNLISIGCSGALLLSLVFEMEIKYMMMMMMSSHTSLSDHCNSVPRSASVIHSEPLLNIEWERWAVSDSDSSEEEQ